MPGHDLQAALTLLRLADLQETVIPPLSGPRGSMEIFHRRAHTLHLPRGTAT
jgi:hypothetical protein